MKGFLPTQNLTHPLSALINRFGEIEVSEGKSKTAATLLALVGGSFGLHRFYLGNYVWGALYLALCWSGVPFFLSCAEAIVFLLMSDESFQERYAD